MVRQGLTGERLLALFLLGLVLLLPPVIGVFDKPILVAGIPLLFLYLFSAWGGLILLMALTVEAPAAADDLINGEAGAPVLSRDGGSSSHSADVSGD